MTSTSSGWQSTSDWGRYETFTRKDDVLLTTYTSEGTSYAVNDGGLDNESNVDPSRSPTPMVQKLHFFSKPEPVPTEVEDVEKGSDEEKEDPRFKVYSPLAHIHNVDLSVDNMLEFPDLPYKTRDRTSLSLDSGELKVGKEFSSKDSFLSVLKQHSIMNRVNYNVVKSKFEKFEAKCAMQDDVFVYCKPLVKIDGTFMYGRYTHRLLLAVAQDGSGRVLPIALAIKSGESGDDWDFFLFRLRRNVYP
ncbi:hypothetical protein J1N35_014461 [Gossypium stocksii]|uniref:MULE transposase domain-containing protein n=1 Tax=Gossypium stocksii TaxID=47602 RepID=A0A9D3VU50_9ROSI|nr:hypothetical protein J1N35_014461 [Gossypium stocksii]